MRLLTLIFAVFLASTAYAQELVTVGSIDVCHDVFVSDSASSTGAGKTGIAYNAAGLVCKYKRGNQASATTMTLVDGTVGTQLDNSWKEDANGWYQICPPDAAYASGRNSKVWCYGATDMAPMNLRIVLTADAQDVADVTFDAAGTELAACPSGTATPRQQLMYLFEWARNKIETTTTNTILRKDDGSTALCTHAISDNGTTFSRGEGS